MASHGVVYDVWVKPAIVKQQIAFNREE